ncbi:hypothetical protein [Nocardia testacea]|uniref:hypothetical protein n=1 Tax=Nocardia testacea TaxID=248551 RepID=UPI003410965A
MKAPTPSAGFGVDRTVAHRDLHHRPQDDLVLLGLAAQLQRYEAFEVAVQLPGGLPPRENA